MKDIQVYTVKSVFGFDVELPHDGHGHFYCLVCGYRWPVGLPWELDGSITCEFCPLCRVHYGVVDMPRSHEGQTHAQRITELRNSWLDKTGWQDADLARLEDVLGVVIDKRQRPE